MQPTLSVRTRLEGWDWFDAGPEGKYAYGAATIRAGLAGQSSRFAWRAELAVPVLVGLPDDAVRPAPAGQLGAGASTFAASGMVRDVLVVLPRQLWVRVGRAGEGANLQLGRFDFNDGAERTPRNATLATVRSQRINQRLIGTFGFSHVQRSFDGLQASLDRPGERWTLTAMRPTEGVFAAKNTSARTLEVDLLYASWSRDIALARGAADLRVFAIHNEDRRRGVVKTDNRALATRQAEIDGPSVTTVGAHWLQVVPTRAGAVDLLAWGALQQGAWGALDHRAMALALEAGFQPQGVRGKPWLRGGLLRTSGDADAADGTHGTFFPVTPTPRVYARFPFYNMANSDEYFGTLQVQPHKIVSVRAGLHRLRLSSAQDFWYVGGGAFEKQSFGYAGRPANGSRDLALVADLSAEYRPHRRWAIELYGGTASGGTVIDRIYPGGGDGRLAYVETRYTW
ncbi:MAG: alginate export family protein [Gemmatimonadaceae bacterium]